MRAVRFALTTALALTPLAALAQQVPIAAPAVEPIAYTERTLANGLEVYAIRDTGTATVSVQVWYDVGSKDDPKGRSGFAHMFEHLMFKGTRNLVDEQVDRLTEDVGGYNNASTADDYTNYYEVVPANHLQRLLFAEADRMASLVVDPKVFASERDVVKEELRSRVLAQPYGKLFYVYFPQVSYTQHPYARPGIGSIADLDSATIDDIRAFHATYYRPDNAVLVVAGNFEPAQLDAWVDQYFAPIAKPDRAIPRVDVQEPLRAQPVSYTVYEPNTPLPAVMLSYPIPPASDADTAALSVLDAILSNGDNSRLYQSLVYRDQLAQSASTYFDSKAGPGSLGIYAILAGGKTADAGEAALRREVARLRDAPVSAAELAEARNEILTATLRARETAEGKASAIANAVIIEGDPRAADRELPAITAVTAADVQRVARKYLDDRRSAAIRYLPAESAPAETKGDTIAVAATVRDRALVAPANIVIHTPAPAGERILPPEPAAPVAAALPTPVETRLANGLRLIVVEKPGLPLLTAALVGGNGSATDPTGKAGLHSVMAELLTKGTTTRSATQIAAAVESLGGSLSSGADWDGSAVSLTVKSDQAQPALAILADVARNPAFAAEELDRTRAQAIDEIKVQLTDPGALSRIVAQRAVFGNTPYGNLASGTPTSLPRITRDDLATAYRDSWSPNRATLLMVGDITADAARAVAERTFGDWQAPPATPPRIVSMGTVPETPRIVLIDMPDAGQAGVVLARPGIRRSDADYYAASVANATLGVGFSSRLNQEIRIKRGLAYGAGSSLDARRQIGPMTAVTQTKNESAVEVVALIRAEMDRLGRETPPATEIGTRKAVLTGGFGRAVETTDGIADILGDYVLEQVPMSELQRFAPAIEATTPAQVQAAAAKFLSPDRASIVVVGNAKLIEADLRKAYPALEVIPATALKLDSVTLR